MINHQSSFTEYLSLRRFCSRFLRSADRCSFWIWRSNFKCCRMAIWASLTRGSSWSWSKTTNISLKNNGAWLTWSKWQTCGARRCGFGAATAAAGAACFCSASAAAAAARLGATLTGKSDFWKLNEFNENWAQRKQHEKSLSYLWSKDSKWLWVVILRQNARFGTMISLLSRFRSKQTEKVKHKHSLEQKEYWYQYWLDWDQVA